MSKDIQAPDLSLNVRYSRRDENNGDKEESQVEIYENEDTLKHSHTDLWSHKVRPLTQNNLSAVKRSHFGATAVILGVLYLLIFAGIFVRYILTTFEKQNLGTERDQLHVTLNKLNISLNQLNVSLNQAQTRIINLTEERDELQARYDNLTKSYSQLEEEQNELKDKLRTRNDNLRSSYSGGSMRGRSWPPGSWMPV